MARGGGGGGAGEGARDSRDALRQTQRRFEDRSTATSTGLAEQAPLVEQGLLHTRGATPGPEAPKEQKTTQRPEEARGQVGAGQASQFVRHLAESTSAGEGGGDGAGAAGAGAFGFGGPQLGPSVAEAPGPLLGGGAPEHEREESRPRPARPPGHEWGDGVGGGEGGAGGAAGDAGGGRDDGLPHGARLRPVRAGGRAAVVGLAELLEEGRRAGLLTPWQREIAEAMLRRMTTGGFDLLRQALAALEESVMRRILVLKAAIVHRHPSSLIGFASEIGHLQEETLRARHAAATEGAAVAGARAAFEPGALRRFHDPVTALGEGASAWDGVPEGEAWPVPRWLRGIPREPLELSIVAFDQALTGDLDPEEPTGDGASDALTRALVLHGEAHAALARWQLALCAKADSREGLLRAMDAMRRAGAGALALLAGLLVLSAGAPGAAEASAPAAQLVVAMDIDAGAVSNLAAPDSQASVHPGAEEICDGIDTDCDGLELDADVDADGDGWFACNGDCDDSNSLIHPGRPETCGDSWDYDCDGVEAMGVDDPDCWARPQTEGAGSAGAGCARSESLGCAPERPEPPPPLFAALSAAALLLRRDERRRRPRVGIPAPDADPALDPESGEREAQRH